jgi:hypothetical protein
MRISRFVRAAGAALAIVGTVGAPSASAAEIEFRRDGSKAVPVVVPALGPSDADTGDGFHLGDAGVGAAGMLALVLTSAGVVAVRGRRRPARPLERS